MKLPGPRTYSFAAAFSAAISNIRSPERTAWSLSVRWTVRKAPETVPRAQPVCGIVSWSVKKMVHIVGFFSLARRGKSVHILR
jgi:hypothetical protein